MEEDGLLRHVREQVEQAIRGQTGPFEIEAKFGRLVERQSGQRVQLPVLSECALLQAESWTRFEAELPLAIHKHLNGVFNQNCVQLKWKYRHLRLVDNWWRVGADRVRVTTDTATGTVTQACVKERLLDIAIHLPVSQADVRISVNRERSLEWPPLSTVAREEAGSRHKDRLSYQFEGVTIDLTQVNQDGAVKHELEVEIGDPAHLPALLSTLRRIGRLLS